MTSDYCNRKSRTVGYLQISTKPSITTTRGEAKLKFARCLGVNNLQKVNMYVHNIIHNVITTKILAHAIIAFFHL